MDKRFQTTRYEDVRKWFDRMRPDDRRLKRIAPKSSAAQETLENWRAAGLNVFELKHKINPCAPARDLLLHTGFQFIIEEGPFKPRDIAEYIRETYPDMSARALEKESKSICNALVEAGVLKREGRGILCLVK